MPGTTLLIETAGAVDATGERVRGDGASGRRWRARQRRALLWIGAALLLGWFALVAWSTFGPWVPMLRLYFYVARRRPHDLEPLFLTDFPELGQRESIAFVVAIALAVSLPPLVVRLLRPRLAIPALLAVCGGLMVALAFGAGALIDLLVVLLMTLAAYELGRLSLSARRWLPPRGLESFLLCHGLGSGLLALGGLALGSLGLFSGPILVVPLAILTALAWVRWIRAVAGTGPLAPGVRGIAWCPTFFELSLLSVASTFLLVGYSMAVSPELMSDAVRHHLAMARAFADRERVEPLPHMYLSYWPMHGQLLFGIATAIHGPVAAKLVHAAAGVLTVVTVGVIGRQVAGPTAGVLAATILAALPAVVWQVGTGYIDLFLMLYGALGALCLLRWQESGEARWALLLGAALGFGFAASPKFLLALVGFGLGFGCVLVRPTRATVGRRLSGTLLVVVGGVVTYGPWLARSLLLGEIPGLAAVPDVLGREGEGVAAQPVFSTFGLGRGPAELLRLPWAMTFQSSRFGENADGFLGYALLLLLPLVLLLRPTRATLALGLVVVGSFLPWFYLAQYIRYLLPTLGLVAVLLGAAVVRLGDLGGQAFGRGRGYLAPPLSLAFLGVLVIAITPYLATIFAYPGALPVRLLLGQESSRDYLPRLMPPYATLERLDQEVPPGAAVASLTDIPQLYTHAVVLNPLNGLTWILGAPPPADLLDRLRARAISHLLVNRNILEHGWYGETVLQPEFLRDHTTTVYAGNNVYLYRLWYDGPPAAATGPELLKNAGFEVDDGNGAPASWEVGGTPIYDTSGTRARAGRGAVLVRTHSAVYIQEVSIRGGTPYLLSYAARADEPGVFARLQINWLAANKEFLGPAIEVVPIGPDYATRTMWTRAPPEAAYARVYVSSHGDMPAWFDEYSLTEAE